MAIDTQRFRVGEGQQVRLGSWPTRIEPIYRSTKLSNHRLSRQVAALNVLQELHYATKRHAVLLIFQALDAAGKDAAIRHVMSGINPQGCQVFSFKPPSAAELEHDFLWRTTLCLPERGRIGIFNRSYYEEVLIVRVHPELLGPEAARPTARLWKGRYRSIVDHEDHLHRNGTRVVKFFLHLSKEEQRRRFLARIDRPEKNWKFDPADLAERRNWNQYQTAFSQCLTATSTARAPWYVVPADDKETAHLVIAQVVLETFRKLRLKVPRLTAERRRELEAIRRKLVRG